MKKLLLMLCLTTAVAFGEKKETAAAPPKADCKVTFAPIECYLRNAVECYNAKSNLEGGSYDVSIIPRTSSGYTIYYSRNGGDLQRISGSYETKGEALSAWIEKVIGDGCTYSFK